MSFAPQRQHNLILVSTPYHVHVAFDLIDKKYCEDENTVVSISALSSNAIDSQISSCSGKSVRVIHACFSTSGTFPRRSTFTLLLALLLSRQGLYFDKRVRALLGIHPDRLLVFSPNALTLLVRSIYPCAKTYLCEEGIGSYTGTILERKFYLDSKDESSSLVSRAMLRINSLLFDGKLFLRPCGMMLYQPSLATARYPFPVVAIDRMAQKPKLQGVPAAGGIAPYQWRVIFIGQAVEGGAYDHIKRDEMLFEAISKRIPDVVYRRHPRDQRELRGRILDATDNWEDFCAEVDADRTVLISDFSTAAVVPKLLEDKEPWLLFLFDFEREEGILPDNIEEFFARFAVGYQHHDRVMLPRNESELADACGRIRLLSQKEADGERK